MNLDDKLMQDITSAPFLIKAIMEHYAQTVAPIIGKPEAEIMSEIEQSARNKHKRFKEVLNHNPELLE